MMAAKYRLLRRGEIIRKGDEIELTCPNGWPNGWGKCQPGYGNIGAKLRAGPHEHGATKFRRRVPANTVGSPDARHGGTK